LANADALLSSLDADVIVLDRKLPTVSGIDLLPELRRRGVNLPVMFLTSHPEPANEQLALERGVLDFVDKIRGVEVLASRLRLVSEPASLQLRPSRTPSLCATSSFSARRTVGPTGTMLMSASPSVSRTSSIS
jgi:DNA-binding response OmpR family regulator